ncbi:MULTISPECIES: nitrate/nitrite transporter [unclassified Lentimicrobium]|uniref:MFS transporter n=1 Tax=unclassified Lentimicrobium TaxID=2677434 RepID=UPI00155304C2|nr:MULTISPECIES: MFS transporter [unclassified Lentimicrobium]NPD47535.1 MFS transporter [Lentimicrobium sp. S6]NPD86882.1 MFS transporter [Lentimicrobium sp. L6]
MKQKRPPWYFLVLLILAGESVFVVPFIIVRVFRPAVLEVFHLSNLELGFCFSILGVIAFFSYFFGGPLADKYPPRKLIAVALWMTALGGVYYYQIPGYTGLKILYGYWGFTTIFLFWAPMIKAARVWGGATSQGKAFGFLDGGRGLVGALFGALGLLIFSLLLGDDIQMSDAEETKKALKQVIMYSSIIVTIVGVFVWFFMKLDRQIEKEISIEKIQVSQIKEVLALPSVWLLMMIILCAYVGYKITDIISLYAQEVMLYDHVKSAQIGTFLLFMRMIIGTIIGLLADKTESTFLLIISFGLTLIASLAIALGFITASVTLLFILSILILSTGVYAARSLYFAVMEKGNIPVMLTGTAVGLVSLIGYAPDIFVGPIMGHLLDSSPGLKGHQHVFWILVLFSIMGSVAAFVYYQMFGRKKGSILK